MQSPYSAERLNGACVVIDRLDAEGAALALFLRRRGAVVVLADPDPVAAAPAGCSVVADRVAAVALADVVLVDCWTGEVEPHVIAARARGVPVRGLADIVLHEANTPVVGVTGTADEATDALLSRVLAFSASYGGSVRTSIPTQGRRTRRWAICSGGGASSETLREARDRGVDTLIVGEGPHHTTVEAIEHDLCVMYAGHYATETLGVQALGAFLEARFGIPWTFLRLPTGS